MCIGSLDHLDNCKSFGVFNILCLFKARTRISNATCRGLF